MVSYILSVIHFLKKVQYVISRCHRQETVHFGIQRKSEENVILCSICNILTHCKNVILEMEHSLLKQKVVAIYVFRIKLVLYYNANIGNTRKNSWIVFFAWNILLKITMLFWILMLLFVWLMIYAVTNMIMGSLLDSGSVFW